MAARARCAVAAAAPRPEDRARGWQGLVVAVLLASSSSVSSSFCPRSTDPRSRDFGDFVSSTRGEGLLPRRMGLVRGARRARRLQYRARRGAALSRAAAAANEGCLWKVRLGRQRGAVRALPPASAVDDSLRPGGHLRLALIPRGGSRARGWGSSCTRLRASSPSSSSSASSLSSAGTAASRDERASPLRCLRRPLRTRRSADGGPPLPVEAEARRRRRRTVGFEQMQKPGLTDVSLLFPRGQAVVLTSRTLA